MSLHEEKLTPKACLIFKGEIRVCCYLESSQPLFCCFLCFSPINGNGLIPIIEPYWKGSFRREADSVI